MKQHETIIFRKKDRETKEELFQRVGEQIRILLEEGYLAVVQYDEPGLGIIVVEFGPDDRFVHWGCSRPVWLTPEEEEALRISMSKDDEENCCQAR